MAFDLNNFVIDRVLRGVAVSQGDVESLGLKEGDVLFSINQITNPSLTCSSESTDAVDALGTPIATFYRSKSAEFSAENALFDLNLMATQSGTVKKVAASDDKIVAPCFDEIEVKASATIALAHAPKTPSAVKLYVLSGDGTFGDKITIDSTASKREKATISGATLTIVLDEAGVNGFKAGEQLIAIYDYEADGSDKNGAIEVVNSATNFPVGCKFIMEILGSDVCNQTELIYAYLIFPNAKLSPDFDWNIATDSTHPFSLKAMQEYCDKEKKLFSIVIPE